MSELLQKTLEQSLLAAADHINEQQSQLRTLAEAVINGHDCCDYDGDCNFVGGCKICSVAREIMEAGND